jgi:hypothetical protein
LGGGRIIAARISLAPQGSAWTVSKDDEMTQAIEEKREMLVYPGGRPA